MDIKDISIVIPNYNGEKLLKENLPKVIEEVGNYKDGKAEIIIVDDASTDGSVKVINELFINGLKSSKEKSVNPLTCNRSIRTIRNEKNLGFSSTVNHGVSEAKGQIAVLLNSDVVPEKDFLLPLLSHFRDEKVFAVGCLDKSIENGKTILRGRGLGQWKRGVLTHRRGEVDKTNTLWVSGGSGAFRKSIWKKLGGFNELYNPFYWEDIDLSYRALKSDYKILFDPKSIVRHKHEEGSIKTHYSEFQIKTISYKNQFIFVWENATDLDLQFLHVFWLPYHFVKALLRKDWAFFVGFLEAFILLPKIIKSSFKAQRLFIKTDEEVISDLEIADSIK